MSDIIFFWGSIFFSVIFGEHKPGSFLCCLLYIFLLKGATSFFFEGCLAFLRIQCLSFTRLGCINVFIAQYKFRAVLRINKRATCYIKIRNVPQEREKGQLFLRLKRGMCLCTWTFCFLSFHLAVSPPSIFFWSLFFPFPSFLKQKSSVCMYNLFLDQRYNSPLTFALWRLLRASFD